MARLKILKMLVLCLLHKIINQKKCKVFVVLNKKPCILYGLYKKMILFNLGVFCFT